jgi:gamma-glutamyltranspeptidase
MAFGVMGAHYQPGTCADRHNMIDHGMDVQAAIGAPRVLRGGRPRSSAACRHRLPAAERPRPRRGSRVLASGGAQAIRIDWRAAC